MRALGPIMTSVIRPPITNSSGASIIESNATSAFRNITDKVSLVAEVNITDLPKSIPYTGLKTFQHGATEIAPAFQNNTKLSKMVFTFPSLSLSSNSSYSANSSNSTVHNLTRISTPLNVITFHTPVDKSSNQCNGCVPPDVQIAAGITPQYNTQIILVNKAVVIQGQTFPCPNGRICTGGGHQSIPSYIGGLFGFPPNSANDLWDPKIIYDKLSGRWFASILDRTSNFVRVAVSPPQDSPGMWKIYEFPFDGGCPDQPKIGVNDNLFVISAGIVTPDCGSGGTFTGIQFHLVKKSDLLAFVDPPMTVTIGQSSQTLTPFTPVHSLSPNSDLILVGTDWRQGGPFLTIYTYNLVGSSPQLTGCQPCLIPTQINGAIPSAQPGTDIQLVTNDNRILDAAFYQGKLWVSFNDSCIPSGDTVLHSCLGLMQLETFGSGPGFQFIVRQDFRVGYPNTDLYFPALRVDGNGNMVVVFGASSSSLFPSVFVSSQNIGDPPQTLRAPMVLAAGTTSDTDISHLSTSPRCTNCILYGDYFSAAVDAFDPSTIWVAGEYMKEINSSPAYSIVVGQVK